MIYTHQIVNADQPTFQIKCDPTWWVRVKMWCSGDVHVTEEDTFITWNEEKVDCPECLGDLVDGDV